MAKALHRTFCSFEAEIDGSRISECPSMFEGVSHILVYVDGEEHSEHQTLVGSIMEMIAATVVGSCWPKAPSSV